MSGRAQGFTRKKTKHPGGWERERQRGTGLGWKFAKKGREIIWSTLGRKIKKIFKKSGRALCVQPFSAPLSRRDPMGTRKLVLRVLESRLELLLGSARSKARIYSGYNRNSSSTFLPHTQHPYSQGRSAKQAGLFLCYWTLLLMKVTDSHWANETQTYD